MFDQVPVQAWLLIAIAAVAYAPARYAFEFVATSPSRRDITQRPGDLSWRTSAQLVRCLVLLAILFALAVFIFTPAAAQFAHAPVFWPLLIAACGAWSVYTVPMGFVTGNIEPFVRGFNDTYQRDSQPKRYWASMVWNAAFGSVCIWLAIMSYGQMMTQPLQDQCYNRQKAYQPHEALAACNKLIDAGDRSKVRLADYLHSRGIAYARSGDDRRAIVDYNEAIRLDPSDQYPYYNRGLAHERLGDTQHAIADFTAAIRLEPNDADAYLNRGLIFLDTRKFDEAAADFTQAHRLDKDNAWPLANRGISYAWRNDRVRAEADFKAARAIDPSNPTVLRGEALLAMNAGDFDLAVSLLTTNLKTEPNNRFSLAMRSEAFRLLGDDEKSQADLEHLAKVKKGDRR